MNTKLAYCPTCKYYGSDCHPDPEEFDLPCDSYEPNIQEDIELGLMQSSLGIEQA